MSPTVAIIGGGITGISAALEASRLGADVHLFEANDRLGGKVGETELDGRMLPTAPDNFLARRPEVSDLAHSLGLESHLVSPSAASPRIYRDGVLHRLPPNVLGIPAVSDLTPGLLSQQGIDRLSQDLDLGSTQLSGDESAGSLVRRRLGDEALEYLVDPLLGGINAGDSDRLSIEAGVPQLATLRDKDPSLINAAAATLEGASTTRGPVFRSISGGLTRLVDAAQDRLLEAGTTVELGTSAGIQRDGARWLVDSTTAASRSVDHVVIATPAFAAADLIGEFAPAPADRLRQIDYSSVALCLMVLPPNTIDIDSSISGVLVPRLCGLHVTAVSFASHKWPELADDGAQVLRVSVGRRTHTSWQELSDDELLEHVRADLSKIFGGPVPRGPARVARWNRSLPQYDVGHRERVQALDEELTPFVGLTLTGAWRDGLGLPACVAAGRTAVRNILGV